MQCEFFNGKKVIQIFRHESSEISRINSKRSICRYLRAVYNDCKKKKIENVVLANLRHVFSVFHVLFLTIAIRFMEYFGFVFDSQ